MRLRVRVRVGERGEHGQGRESDRDLLLSAESLTASSQLRVRGGAKREEDWKRTVWRRKTV